MSDRSRVFAFTGARERESKGSSEMRWESCSTSPTAATAGGGSSSSASPGGKRSRDPEDELYVDNLHSHKRYLSEIMASSLNGLTVGDTMPENIMESPSRSEGLSYHLREEFTIPYSPMSEDSDDSRLCETPVSTAMVQPDVLSRPTSPVSPHRHQRPLNGFSPSNAYPPPSYSLPSVVCCNPRHRGSDTEGRFPSSPSDMCHAADLRKTALLRSVQMRAQPHCPPPYELPFSIGQESMSCHGEEESDSNYSCLKNLDDVIDYPSSEHLADNLSEPEHADQDNCYTVKFPSKEK